MAYEMQSFEEDVLAASKQLPIVVDFWAPWCGPCRVLGPVLEQLAAGNGDRWRLVKVNTDEHPELSMQYGIRGIPAVKMFVDGAVADEFTGALPKHAVEQWLERSLPTATRRLAEDAHAALREGRTEDAQTLLLKALEEDPHNAGAAVSLAQLVLFDEPARARQLVESVEILDPVMTQVADGIATIARLVSMSPPYNELPTGPGRDAYIVAIDALRESDIERALEAFITVVGVDRYYDDDGARKANLALFSILGEDHALTRKYRPQFNMALY